MRSVFTEQKRVRISWTGLLVFFIIFISNDTFYFGTNINNDICSIPRYFSILVCVILIIKAIKSYAFKLRKLALLLFTFVSLYLVACIANHDTVTYTGIYLVYILLAFLISITVSFRDFWRYFEKFVFFLAIISIITEVVAYVFPKIISSMPVSYNVNNVPFFYFVVGGLDLRTLGTSFIRAGSIFWEPGVWAVYLNLSLFIYIFIYKDPKLSRIIVYSLSVLLTFSTAGYFVLAYVILGFFLYKNDKKNKIPFILIIGIAMLSLLAFDSSGLFDAVFGKIQNTNEGTTMARIGSVIVSFDMMKSNPLLGIGMSHLVEIFRSRMIAIMGVPSNDYTNGFLYCYVAYGIPFGLLSTLGFSLFSKNIQISHHSFRLYTIILFIVLFFAEHLNSPLPYIMLFYGYSSLTNSDRGKSEYEIHSIP